MKSIGKLENEMTALVEQVEQEEHQEQQKEEEHLELWHVCVFSKSFFCNPEPSAEKET